jgi:hypothetical protein
MTATCIVTCLCPGPAMLSGLGRPVFGPMPVHNGDYLVLYSDVPLSSSHWEVYRMDQRRIAELNFSSQAMPQWSTTGVAPGLYFIRLTSVYLDGSTHVSTHKIVVLQ